MSIALDYPECSGDPASCPENEGYGCCKPNPSTAELAALRKDAERYRWLRDTGAAFTVRSSGGDGRLCKVYPNRPPGGRAG